jgi:hypothetical protein
MMELIKKDLPIEIVGGQYKGRHGMLKDSTPFICYVDLLGVPGQKCMMKVNVKLLVTFLLEEDGKQVAESCQNNHKQQEDVNHHIAALERRVEVLEEDNEKLRSLLIKLL